MMALILLFLVFIPASQAACNFSTGWQSVTDISRAQLVENGGESTLIPTEACSLEQGYCLVFFSFVPNKYYLSLLAFSPNSSTLSAAQIIWTANRGSPVHQNSTLSFTEDGDLILQTPDGGKVWSTNTSSRVLSVCGGNLRLVDGNNQSVWDSFSHPTDTLIPSQRLKIGMKLISSRSGTDLSAGRYYLVVEKCGIVLYYHHTYYGYPDLPYWVWALNNTNDTIGVRDQSCKFSGLYMTSTSFLLLGHIPKAGPELIGDSLNSTGSNEILFDNSEDGDPNPYTYLRLEHDGVLRAASFTSGWSKVFELDNYLRDPCFIPTICGTTEVCITISSQKSECTCPNSPENQIISWCSRVSGLFVSGKHIFVPFRGIEYIPSNYMAPSNYSTEKSCKDACLVNFDCVAAFYWMESRSCFHATGSLEGTKATGSRTRMAYLKLPVARSGNSNNYTGLATGLGIGVFVIFVITVFCIRYLLRKRHIDLNFAEVLRIPYRLRKGHTDLDCEEELFIHNRHTDLNSAEVEKEFRNYRPTGQFRRFSLTELQNGTQGFITKVGQGAFGTVFLGSLEGSGKIAVKRVECSRHGKKSFRSEIETLANIQHLNLVHLLGFCVHGNDLLLVYEFVANGSLDQWIFHRGADRPVLNWKQRWHIVCGVARGLAYLHHHCRKCILHLDIKPHNILLDENFEAKVSDFGLSCLMEREQSHLSTTMRGTPGYLAPEWLRQRGINSKGDVYSFGMVVLELISGRKNMDPTIENEDMQHYPSWAWEVFEKNSKRIVAQLVDPLLHGDYSEEEAEILLRVGFMCIRAEASKRPTMDEVVKILSDKIVENDDVVVNPGIGFGVEEQGRGREISATAGGVMELSSIYTHGR